MAPSVFKEKLGMISLVLILTHSLSNLTIGAAYAGACLDFMHFRCENVWNRLAEASRQDSDEMKATKQEPGDSTSERIKKKMRKPNVLMAVPTIYVRFGTIYACPLFH